MRRGGTLLTIVLAIEASFISALALQQAPDNILLMAAAILAALGVGGIFGFGAMSGRVKTRLDNQGTMIEDMKRTVERSSVEMNKTLERMTITLALVQNDVGGRDGQGGVLAQLERSRAMEAHLLAAIGEVRHNMRDQIMTPLKTAGQLKIPGMEMFADLKYKDEDKPPIPA